jgi:predicted ABC-type ATPase
MTEKKRLRIFAGPNGSGKSTLFSDISKKYRVGFFVNSDIVEQELLKTKYINLEDFKKY